jgi:predicted alpha/beta superfamily hydrolase
MFKLSLAAISWLLTISLMAQSSIRFEIKSLPPYHPSGADIYLAGSFNGWNASDARYKFHQTPEGHYYIDLKMDNGLYEYKIARGSWDKVECKKDGSGVPNRMLRVDGNATILLDIEEWKDRFPEKPKVSTASKNVRVIDTAFLIPQLNRVRRIWIYLPEDYATSMKKYPVMYLHDGQNVFDDATSYAGEWGVDEFLDSNEANKCIVVAIDHGGAKRFNEYSPYDHERFGKGEGELYAEFVAKTLKKYIDKNYRTKRSRENTFIAGSSMGGLISFYAVLKYPKVFGGAGVFSPAFWVAPKIEEDIKAKGKKVKGSIYFFAGKLEGETMVLDMLKAFGEMATVSKSKMKSVIRDEGRHNEGTWRVEFPLFYNWMLR